MNQNFMPHFNSVKFLSPVQTLQTSDSVIWVTHTHTLMHLHVKCLNSIAIFTSPFCFRFSGTLFHKSTVLRGAPCMSDLSFSALCTNETHVDSPLLASHTSAGCPESIFLISIWYWSYYNILKDLFNHYRHQSFNHWENTNKRNGYLWLRCS